jgi:hypothetical protein
MRLAPETEITACYDHRDIGAQIVATIALSTDEKAPRSAGSSACRGTRAERVYPRQSDRSVRDSTGLPSGPPRNSASLNLTFPRRWPKEPKSPPKVATSNERYRACPPWRSGSARCRPIAPGPSRPASQSLCQREMPVPTCSRSAQLAAPADAQAVTGGLERQRHRMHRRSLRSSGRGSVRRGLCRRAGEPDRRDRGLARHRACRPGLHRHRRAGATASLPSAAGATAAPRTPSARFPSATSPPAQARA